VRSDLPILYCLAQSSGGMGGVIGWSLVLIVLVIIGAAGVLRLRRWLKEDDVPSGGIGFTLSDLRQLHQQGKMTDAEFERARAKMVDAGRAMAAKMPHPLARPEEPPELRGSRRPPPS
jgi:hypothetical protein